MASKEEKDERKIPDSKLKFDVYGNSYKFSSEYIHNMKSSMLFAEDIMSSEDAKLWRTCIRYSSEEIYLKMKYGAWCEDVELEHTPVEFHQNVEIAKEMMK